MGIETKSANLESGNHQSNSGFTLIEVIISIAVLTIALTGLVTTLYRSVQLDNSFGNRSIALQGAQKMMAQIKAKPRQKDGKAIKEFIDGLDEDGDGVNEYDVTGLQPDITAEGIVEYEDMGGFIKVDIIVKWKDQMGQQDITITSNFYTYEKS